MIYCVLDLGISLDIIPIPYYFLPKVYIRDFINQQNVLKYHVAQYVHIYTNELTESHIEYYKRYYIATRVLNTYPSLINEYIYTLNENIIS